MKNSTKLRDRISPALEQEGAKVAKGDDLYPESMFKMTAGVKAGTLHSGKLNINPYHFHKGSIGVPLSDRVLLLDTRPGTSIVLSTGTRLALIDEAKVSQGAIGEGKPHTTAWVVGVIKRNRRYYVGHLDPSPALSVGGRSQRNVFLIPMEKKIPKIRFRRRQASELFGKRMGVSIHAWDGTSRYRTPQVISSGRWGRLRLSDIGLFAKRGARGRVPQDPEDPRLQQMVDYRGLLVCSIDLPDCQDIDDALHASCMPNGKYEVNVHIADATHFVKPNAAMDNEASVRGTIVFLLDKRVDMLTMLLGTDICSLKPHNDELTQGMRTLLILSKKLWQKRMAASALNLASPAVNIESGSETSDPIDVKTKEMLETHSLVE
ncbi:hypothetical protein HOY82DRAFT_631100 [Tuber indicum]|nr:hypothetical protein HOY82DRAFT_631100 [Tuber indicum]